MELVTKAVVVPPSGLPNTLDLDGRLHKPTTKPNFFSGCQHQLNFVLTTAMDPGRKAMIAGRRLTTRDIASPRRDTNNRVSKPQLPSASRRTPDFRPPRNNTLDDEQTKKWVSQEDSFVLKQAKKKADIRVREGRAKPIDWLSVILRVIDPDRDLLEDDEEEVQLDVVDPEGVFESLSDAQLVELESDITSYLTLE